MFHVKQTTAEKADSLVTQLQFFERWLRVHSIPLPAPAGLQLRRYVGALLEWNQRVNLISRADEAVLVERHLCESAVPLFLLRIAPESNVLDIGSGAGFPGVVWKVLRPDLHLTLVESQRRRALFLRHVTQLLGLADVQVLYTRAENLADDLSYQGSFDFATARAVAPLRRLWEWSRPLLKFSGALVAFKGGDVAAEVEALQTAFSLEIDIIPFPEEEPFKGRGRKLVLIQEKEL